MKCLEGFVLLTALAVTSAAFLDFHPLSDERINLINKKAKTWKAGRNFDVKEWESVKRMSSGVLRRPSSVKLVGKINPHNELEDVPASFDSRENWPNCKSIQQIWDQSDCGSCWALGAVAAMSDRICIYSNQTKQTFVSAEDLNSCCDECGFGCEGGYPEMAWLYWQSEGIVTGGLYQSNEGCKDYSLQPCEHHVDGGTRPQCSSLNYDTPDCVKTCDDSSVSYDDSLTYGQEPVYLSNEKQIQLELVKNGPVETSFTVYDDFPNYKSGVYQATSDVYLGGHAVKIIGWGVEDDTPYWLIANSWNTDWGLDGYVKFLRGEDHCGIEDSVVAALPKN